MMPTSPYPKFTLNMTRLFSVYNTHLTPPHLYALADHDKKISTYDNNLIPYPKYTLNMTRV